jgi:hypothetical protein
MLSRVAGFGCALVLWGCSERIILEDIWDGGLDLGGADAESPRDQNTDLQPSQCLQYQSIDYRSKGAQLLILLDRSASMQVDFGGKSRVQAVQAALAPAILRYQKRLKIGFEQFPVVSGAPNAEFCQPSCCAEKVMFTTAYDQGEKLTSTIACDTCIPPLLDSCSQAALLEASDYYHDTTPSDDDRSVLLITSSDPSSGSDKSEACNIASNATIALGNSWVQLIILSVGYQPDQWSCLSKLTPGYPYTASNIQELNSKVMDIFGTLARTACYLNTTAIPPTTPLMVSIGDDPVEYSDKVGYYNGWSFANFNQTRIVIKGTDCVRFLDSSETAPDVSYMCTKCPGFPYPPCY